ncbi:MAG TPA: energy-coupling factor transporter transmembrane component T [Fibrobacteria bacterium]|nr:energy-coupling factor transporter transmembrane component T [Fibrobacteria bacterium]
MILRRMLERSTHHPLAAHSAAVIVVWAGTVVVAQLAQGAASHLILLGILALLGFLVDVDFRLWGKSLGAIGLMTGSALLALAVGWRNGHPSWDPEAATSALRAFGRSMVCAGATLLMAQTVPFSRWLAVLERLGVPAGVVELVGLVHRAILVLEDSLAGVQRGMACRNAFAHRGGSPQAWRLGVVSLFLRSQKMAIRQERALESRGWTDRLGVRRSAIRWWCWSTAVAFLGVLGMAVGISWLERGHAL